jgi:hypothetical protein
MMNKLEYLAAQSLLILCWVVGIATVVEVGRWVCG